MADEEPREARGVHNPKVVDLIRVDETTQEVVLLMLEPRPWGSDPSQLRQLEAKFNSYIDYVLGGHMAQQYPGYADRTVRFELSCAANPPATDAPFFTAMSNFAASENIRFVVLVRDQSEHALDG